MKTGKKAAGDNKGATGSAPKKKGTRKPSSPVARDLQADGMGAPIPTDPPPKKPTHTILDNFGHQPEQQDFTPHSFENGPLPDES